MEREVLQASGSVVSTQRLPKRCVCDAADLQISERWTVESVTSGGEPSTLDSPRNMSTHSLLHVFSESEADPAMLACLSALDPGIPFEISTSQHHVL